MCFSSIIDDPSLVYQPSVKVIPFIMGNIDLTHNISQY